VLLRGGRLDADWLDPFVFEVGDEFCLFVGEADVWEEADAGATLGDMEV
jgi:hypothetical protein